MRQVDFRFTGGTRFRVRHVIGPDFWKLSFEELHRTSVNTSEIIDDIRARIFIKSIQLHRLTILSNAKRF